MRIGHLAQRTGISQRALRYYEEQHLLRPTRQPSGYREYSEADLQTVRRIRVLLAAGLNTATIAEVLPCLADNREDTTPMCPELLTGLSRNGTGSTPPSTSSRRRATCSTPSSPPRRTSAPPKIRSAMPPTVSGSSPC